MKLLVRASWLVVLATCYSTLVLTSFQNCGHTETIRRLKIVGGRIAESFEFPWAARLIASKSGNISTLCSASLIAENWAITAAHCLSGGNITKITLQFGRVNVTEDAETYFSQIRESDSAFIHASYNETTLDFDFALINFTEPVNFTKSVRPICLPEEGACTTTAEESAHSRTSDSCRPGVDRILVAGWGRTDPKNNFTSKVLKNVDLSLFSRPECKERFGRNNFKSNVICAGNQGSSNAGGCRGDSGSALTCYRNKTAYILGVVSFGTTKDCGEPYQPDAFARVCSVLPWIRQVLNGSVERSNLSEIANPDYVEYESRTTTFAPGVTKRMPDGSSLGWSDIHHAAYYGNLHEVKRLINISGNEILFNETSVKKHLPIHLAAWLRRLEVVKFLVEIEPSLLNMSDPLHYFPVQFAAASNDRETLKYFLEELKYGVETKIAISGRTLLHVAARESKVVTALYLAEKGANVWAKSSKNDSEFLPIHLAAMGGSVLVTSMLLDRFPNMANVTNAAGEMPLHVAASYGQIDVLGHLIEERRQPVDLRTKNSGKTALHHAATGGHLEAFEYLLEKGANVSAKSDDNGMTVAHFAAYNGSIIMQLICTKFPNLTNETDNFGNFPIHSAAYAGSVDVLSFLLDNCSGNVEQRSLRLGRTALHQASQTSLAAVKFLIQRNASLWVAASARTDFSSLPIHIAAEFGKTEIVSHFLDIEPRLIEAKNIYDQTPLLRAVVGGSLKTVQLLVNNYSAPVDSFQFNYATPLHMAATKGYLKIAGFLLEKGANLELRVSTDGSMPIHNAAHTNRVDVVDLFVRANTNLTESGTNSGETALHLAALNGHKETLNYLLKAANVSAHQRNVKSGYTALHYSAQSDRLEILKYLILRHGANLYAKSFNYNLYPIHIAAYYGSLESLKYMIELQRNLTYVTNSFGDMPIHDAVLGNRTYIVRYFLESRKVNIEIRTKVYGHTLIHVAAANGRLEILQYLIGAGADVNSKQFSKGDTVLHTAVRNRKTEVVQFLLRKYPHMVCARNNRLETPRQLANGDFGITKILLEAKWKCQ